MSIFLYSKSPFLGLIAILTLLAATPVSQAQSYSAVDLGSVDALAINNSGTVVGSFQTTGGATHAFSLSDGTMIDLGTLGGTNSVAEAINNSGTIVGYADIAMGLGPNWSHAFSYNNGTMTDLETVATNYSEASGINDSGTIVGTEDFSWAFSYSNGVMSTISAYSIYAHAYGINDLGTFVGGTTNVGGGGPPPSYAFSCDNGLVTLLGNLGGAASNAANAINNSGVIVGYSSSYNAGGSGFIHAFSYYDGVMTDLGAGSSSANAINNAGVIVGQSASGAFIYQNGTVTDLNSLVNISGTTLTNAAGINDLGQIIASGSNGDAYLLSPISTSTSTPTPTPTPTTAPTPSPTIDAQNVVWTNTVGATATGNNLTRGNGAAGWTAAASSTVGIALAGGYIQFAAAETNTDRMCGLSVNIFETDYTGIRYAVYLASDGSFQVFEGGAKRGSFGAYSTGDVFTVSVAANGVTYSRNGSIFYTSLVAPTQTLFGDASLYSPGATIGNAIIAGNLR